MILDAVRRAYDLLEQRGWSTIYWACDLHDTILAANYSPGGYRYINDDIAPALRLICSLPESRLILWSSVHRSEQPAIMRFLAERDIRVDYFNCNPEVGDTPAASFKEKFYFSILIDDKAGFDPARDWRAITEYLQSRRLQAI